MAVCAPIATVRYVTMWRTVAYTLYNAGAAGVAVRSCNSARGCGQQGNCVGLRTSSAHSVLRKQVRLRTCDLKAFAQIRAYVSCLFPSSTVPPRPRPETRSVLPITVVSAVPHHVVRSGAASADPMREKVATIGRACMQGAASLRNFGAQPLCAHTMT